MARSAQRTSTAVAGFIVLIAAVVAGGMWLRQRSERQTTQDERPLVVATVPHVASWVGNLVGDGARVDVLVSNGIDAHDFTLTPASVVLVAKADVVVANGAGLEPWLPELQAQVSDVPFVATADGLPGVREGDPHTWLDPVLAREQVRVAATGIAAAIPALVDTMSVNVGAYDAELVQLDADIRAALDPLPQRSIITFHESFGYFAERYGLTIPTSLVELPGDEPTAQDIARVGEEARSSNVTTMLVEPGPVPDLAQALADEFDLEIAVLDPLEVLAPTSRAYIDGMRANLAVLVSALD